MISEDNTGIIGLYQTRSQKAVCLVVTHVGGYPIDPEELWVPFWESEFDNATSYERGEEVEFAVSDWILKKRNLL